MLLGFGRAVQRIAAGIAAVGIFTAVAAVGCQTRSLFFIISVFQVADRRYVTA